MQFQTPSAIYDYMQSFIANPPKKFGAFGLERTKFLALLVGNPQENYPVIHIAGTSGKWSTASITAQILKAHGYKTWLHVSPHLLDRRERVLIDNLFADDTILLKAAQQLATAVEHCVASEYGPPSYYEVMIVFAYLCFSLAQVDVAVIEVGCGGLYDGSNIITRQDKISVITRQGYDHQDIVGETLKEIAENDAGIILSESKVVALEQEDEVCNLVIHHDVERKSANIHLVSQWLQYGNIRIENGKTIFDYTEQKDVHLSLVGLFQAENAALALTATQLFCLNFDREKARNWLEQVRFAWRCDIRSIGNRTVVFDGAHNPQKMQALVDTLRVLYPEKKIVRYAAFKQGKDRQEMLDVMQTLSQNFILWSFAGAQDMSFQSVSHNDITNYLPWIIIQSVVEPEDFFSTIEKNIPYDTIVVTTGSLYWLSRVYAEVLT